ncbi:D-alanyl-D-alanine carboxypeptidase [Candidatus Falkowbacteria bacterium]|nr:D-alanyl-D-alanine carboxypeptidase [Candidatus Falkowbacteria bacterium]
MFLASLLGGVISSIFFLNISLSVPDWHMPQEPILPWVKKERIDQAIHWSTELLVGRTALALIGHRQMLRLTNNGLPIAGLRMPVRRDASSTDPLVNASSSIVLDGMNEMVLFAKNEKAVWPIASITKLVTAMVFLDHNPGWDKVYEMRPSDRRDGGKIYLFNGDQVKVKDLFYLSLVASGNSETVALANSTGLTTEEFVAKMNEKMRDLGLNQSSFADVVGLSDQNVSNAQEVALIAKTALAQKEIKDATLTDSYRTKTLAGKEVFAQSTDKLLDDEFSDGITLLGGKTGHIIKAGYCFVGIFANSSRNPVISVILGSPSDASRFHEAYRLADWTYRNYRWQ